MSRHGITITWNVDVVDVLAGRYNIRYGVRSIKHEVGRKVTNLTARANENYEVLEGGRVHITVDEDEKHPVCKIKILARGRNKTRGS
jgi:ATP-dependent Clp protease ATP-binding subunit ClpB